MSKFKREFPVSEVVGSLGANHWLADLLRRWQPAGRCAPKAPADADVHNGNAPLRLAVRDGYLNMYQAGQSVARVLFKNGRPQGEIHEKYIHGSEATGQKYVALTSEGYLDRSGRRQLYAGLSDLDGWIANAKNYVGREKAFVEQIVSRNENVVDLEMALPAYLEEASERRAPRMDLVALEPRDSSWTIVFWEAKLATDPRARCRGDAEPEVCRQLESYTTWLNHDGHRELVTIAYTNACKILVGMHAIGMTVNPDIRPLGEAIRAVASGARALTVDEKPRLLIDDRADDASFTTNGHLQKLRKLGHHVQVIGKDGDMRLEAA